MKIAIAGYGALGKATEEKCRQRGMDLYCVFTRRPVRTVSAESQASVYAFDEVYKHKDKIDVVINCMGSANDLPVTTPYLAKYFNVIDSFDTHPLFSEHYRRVDRYAKESGTLALIACGWDPGLFSVMRAYMTALMPEGKNYTFWGQGVSRGHGNAIRNIEGVLDAVQYTVPIASAVYSVRNGECPDLSEEQMHKRVCFVVAQVGADTKRIEREIKTMPSYFAPYHTEVNFLDYESFLQQHKAENHAGNVIRSSVTETQQSTAEFSLRLSSNPLFTADILLSYAKAVYSLNRQGKSGCITAFDISISELFGQDSLSLGYLI